MKGVGRGGKKSADGCTGCCCTEREKRCVTAEYLYSKICSERGVAGVALA